MEYSSNSNNNDHFDDGTPTLRAMEFSHAVTNSLCLARIEWPLYSWVGNISPICWLIFRDSQRKSLESSKSCKLVMEGNRSECFEWQNRAEQNGKFSYWLRCNCSFDFVRLSEQQTLERMQICSSCWFQSKPVKQGTFCAIIVIVAPAASQVEPFHLKVVGATSSQWTSTPPPTCLICSHLNNCTTFTCDSTI